MLQVKQVVNKVFTSNTYIVFDGDFDDCWLVDIGHTHFDHIYGINELCQRHPECVVYTSEFGKLALMDDRKNLSRYHEHPIVFEGKHLVVVGEDDEIPLMGEQKIKVTTTPGHEPGCLTFFTEDYIFTGDSYIPGVKVVTKLPGGDRALAAESVEKILRLAEGKTICPGHGEIATGSDEQMNKHSLIGSWLKV